MSAPSNSPGRDLMVKVCGITRREDAETAVDAGASALGFVFHPKSPRYVTPEQAAELGAGLDVWKIGVLVDQPAEVAANIARAAKLDAVQLYGGAAPEGVRLWRAFRVNPGVDLSAAAGAEAILLDGPANGIGFDWQRARGLRVKLIVAGGLDAGNVAEAIRVTRPWGVDASSGLESSPGIKDAAKVRAFVAAARQAAGEVAREAEPVRESA